MVKRISLGLSGLLILASAAQALGSNDAPKHGKVITALSGSKASELYGKGEMLSVVGKVVGMQVYKPEGSKFTLEDVLVKSRRGAVSLVELGPVAYMEHQGLSISVGDKLEVYGSKVAQNGDSFVLAKAVLHDGDRIAFRKANGQPYWYSSAFEDSKSG